VLRPGGVLVATTWDRMDMMRLMSDVMTAVLDAPPPPPPVDPMSLSAPGLFEGMVRDAGFGDVACSTSTYPFDLGAEKDVQYKVGTMLITEKVEELGKQQVAFDAFWANAGKYATFSPAGNMVLKESTFKLTVATKN
jgi:hypothetical protein